MAGERREMTLGDAIELKRGYDLPSRDRRDGPFPIVSSSGISGHHTEAKATAPGVVIGRYGTLGEVHYITEDYWPLNTALYVRDFKGNDPRFVSYFLRSLDFTPYSDKAAVPGLNRNDLHTAQVSLPELPEQRAIAHILGTLDDKIELNRRMNDTLEAMARALFKSWFVDFDPVRAKAERRDPRLPQPLADLFPARFIDSELGDIPEGWRVASVYEVADVVYGAPFASVQFNTEGLGEPLIRIRDLPNESPGVWTAEVHAKGYKVRPGDIVIGMDGEFRAYLWGGAEAWLNQRVCVFVPKGGASAAFVRNSIIEPLAQVESTETATTVIHLGKADIDRFSMVLPPGEVLTAFNQHCQPWYERIVAGKQESRTLVALRDTLLPKLISGELHVEDPVRFLGGGD
jgi:type I restriction enzyme, S subunit